MVIDVRRFALNQIANITRVSFETVKDIMYHELGVANEGFCSVGGTFFDT